MQVYRVGEKFRVAHGKDKHGWKLRRWCAVYACQCGKRFVMQCRSEKNTKSCGCHAKETARQILRKNTHRRTHCQTGSDTYRSWQKMRARCNDENNNEFHRYGARGIAVCESWKQFENFVCDMGERPEGHSLDRIDINGNYEKQNCRWATPKQQARNTRRNVIVIIDGQSKTVAEWAEHPRAAKDKTIYRRLKLGWSGREAVFGKQT